MLQPSNCLHQLRKQFTNQFLFEPVLPHIPQKHDNHVSIGDCIALSDSLDASWPICLVYAAPSHLTGIQPFCYFLSFSLFTFFFHPIFRRDDTTAQIDASFRMPSCSQFLPLYFLVLLGFSTVTKPQANLKVVTKISSSVFKYKTNNKLHLVLQVFLGLGYLTFHFNNLSFRVMASPAFCSNLEISM